MPTVIVTTDEKSQNVEIPNNPNFMVLVHQQGMRVDVPTYVEINPRNTIECMEKMTQKQWEWISQGQLFQTLFKMSFDPAKHQPKIPQTIAELVKQDMGIIHISGMIVLGCEACMAGKSLFFRNPECYLHPSTERYMPGMLKKMLELLGNKGQVKEVAEGDDNPFGLTEKEQKGLVPEIIREKAKKLAPEAVEATLKWLHCMEPDKEFASVGDERVTVKELIVEVENQTEAGKQVVAQFCLLRGH